MNLTGARDRAAVDEHIADALSVAHLVRSPLVDVGSGGGLPGIPLALATGARVTLIEASAKKAAFLRDALAELAIEGAVIADRAEIAAHDPALRETFASATARAVGSVSTVLEVTLPFLAIGGVAILQRGRLEEAERRAAVDASLMLGGELVAEERLEGERRLLLVAKRTATPPHFPRRPGVPHRRPLCLAPAARGRRPLA